MNKNLKLTTPRCGICQNFYSSRDDDGSGLCLKCRPTDSQSLLNMKHQLKQIIVMEVGKTMDDFDKEDLKEQEEGIKMKELQDQGEASNPSNDKEYQVIVKSSTGELKIEDIIEPGRYGVSNSQMIPALKIAIAEKTLEKLALLKTSYLYTYSKSIRYLKKAEREFIANNDI